VDNITLKTGHFKGTRIVIAPSFVSNGHWAIPKGFIKNGALFGSPETAQATFPNFQVREMLDVDITRLYDDAKANPGFSALRDTGLILDIGMDPTRLYLTKEHAVVLFSQNYIKLFGIQPEFIAFGSPGRAALIDDALLLMPKRAADGMDTAMASMCSIVHTLEQQETVAAKAA
jgi:hypothetical protein